MEKNEYAVSIFLGCDKKEETPYVSTQLRTNDLVVFKRICFLVCCSRNSVSQLS